jgi:hypothetical protein
MDIATYLSVRDFEECAYLGILLNVKNNIRTELDTRINSANRAYFVLLLLLKSQIIPRYVKIRIYKSLI